MKSRNIIRAKILEVLFKHQYDWDRKHEGEIVPYYDVEVSLASTDIAKFSGFSEEQIESQLIFLLHQKEVKSVQDYPNVWYMLTHEGNVAYSDDKYFKRAKSEGDERVGFLSKKIGILVTVVSLLVTVITLIINISTNRNGEKLDKLNAKIDSIGKKLNER